VQHIADEPIRVAIVVEVAQQIGQAPRREPTRGRCRCTRRRESELGAKSGHQRSRAVHVQRESSPSTTTLRMP
jgi:hypothetical protein